MSEGTLDTGGAGLAAITEAEARFERWRRLSGVVLAPAAFAVAYLTTAGALTPAGRSLAGVLAAVGVLWMTETLSLPATGLLGGCLCVLLGVADAKTVLAPFADPIVFLFIGSFILAQAMALHGLDRRLALAFLSLRWVAGRPLRMLAAVGAATAFLSMWVSNTATAAMMAPIALGMLRALHEMRHPGEGDRRAALRAWPFATAMMLMISYAAMAGGLATPVGSPPNLIALGHLRNLAGLEVSFFAWMALMLPLVLVLMVVLVGLLWLLHPGEKGLGVGDHLARYLAEQRRALGPWTAGQVNTAAAFGVACTLWVLPGVLGLFLDGGHPLRAFLDTRVPEAVAAVLAALLLFVLPTDLRGGRFTISWEEAVRIDWGTILLFGGGLSLGTLMFRTGVAEALGRGLVRAVGAESVWALTAVAIGLSILLSEMSSNTASASMVLPTVIALAQAAGVNPVPPALGACLGASFGFMLPVSTPPNAIVYGTGLVPITRMIRGGVLLDLSGFFLILLGLRVLCPLFGFA